MRKIVTLYCFVITSFLVISGILSAHNLIELGTAILFTPLAFYFTALMVPKKANKINLNIANEPVLTIVPDKIERNKDVDYDPDRRKFLKLIGAAGGSLFLLTLFGTKTAQASFFGSMPGPGSVSVKNSSGTVIDPAEKRPTDGYGISEIDDSGTDAYYGFVNKDGAWFILKDASGVYRYVKGSSSFSTSWTNRASLTYDYFNAVF